MKGVSVVMPELNTTYSVGIGVKMSSSKVLIVNEMNTIVIVSDCKKLLINGHID